MSIPERQKNKTHTYNNTGLHISHQLDSELTGTQNGENYIHTILTVYERENF